MAHFSESLCEEVIRSEGGCGLTRNEMVQMARFALRAIRNENPYIVDWIRFSVIQDALAHFPQGHDEDGIYTEWKAQLDLQLAPLPTAPA